MDQWPIVNYLREVLNEHTLPLAQPGVGMIEARWLVDLLHTVEKVYKNNGCL